MKPALWASDKTSHLKLRAFAKRFVYALHASVREQVEMLEVGS